MLNRSFLADWFFLGGVSKCEDKERIIATARTHRQRRGEKYVARRGASEASRKLISHSPGLLIPTSTPADRYTVSSGQPSVRYRYRRAEQENKQTNANVKGTIRVLLIEGKRIKKEVEHKSNLQG